MHILSMLVYVCAYVCKPTLFALVQTVLSFFKQGATLAQISSILSNLRVHVLLLTVHGLVTILRAAWAWRVGTSAFLFCMQCGHVCLHHTQSLPYV